MDERMKEIGQRIKFLRLKKQISQTDLAKSIGMSQTNLSNLESGRTSVTLHNLFKIKDVLQCEMADFFEDEKPQTKPEVSVDEIIQVLRALKGQA